MTIFEYIADLEPKAGLYPDSIVRMQKFAADEEKRYDAQLAAAQKRIAELETALRDITDQFERVERLYPQDKRFIKAARKALAGGAS